MKQKRIAIQVLIILLILTSIFVMGVGCKKKESSNYQQWKEVLAEYDKWADDYIAFMKKYNSSSYSYAMLSDYTRLLSQYSEWTTKLAAIEDDDTMSKKEEAEILAEYERITLKLANGSISALK